MTLDYNLDSRLQLGLEYNLVVQEVVLRATWKVLEESEKAPLIFLNTSSDRIGTPDGYQVVGINFAKTIPGTTISPYVTVAYSGFEKGLVFPFGASYQISQQWILTGMNDGRKSHLILTYSQKDFFIQAGWIWLRHPAITIGWGF